MTTTARQYTSTSSEQRLFAISYRDMAILLIITTIWLVAWSFAVPIFESPDEPAHWQFARYLHDNLQLPLYGPDFIEANSPPLYYLLIAPVAQSVETPPHLAWWDYHTITVPFPPRFYQNTNADFSQYWPIRAARLITILMSVITVLFCYLAGAEASSKT